MAVEPYPMASFSASSFLKPLRSVANSEIGMVEQVFLEENFYGLFSRGLTLPDNYDLPAVFLKLFSSFLISFHIAPELFIPVIRVCFRRCSFRAFLMSMPETSVNK